MLNRNGYQPKPIKGIENSSQCEPPIGESGIDSDLPNENIFITWLNRGKKLGSDLIIAEIRQWLIYEDWPENELGKGLDKFLDTLENDNKGGM